MFQKIKKGIIVLYSLFLKLNRNTGWLIALSIVIAVCQFVVYAFINKSLGKETLGVWSLVMAATSIGQISNFGFSNSLVRYLPEMLLSDEKENIGKIIGTINFSNFFLTLPILLFLYYPSVEYAAYLLNFNQLQIFKNALQLCIAGLFINSFFSVYSYLLDAMQKYYLRCVIQIAGWVLFFISSIILMPRYGLAGVATSFLLQNMLQFIIIIIVVARNKMLLKIYPVHFDRFFFGKVFSFGVKSQYISILVIFFDPLIKFFITKYIGLTGTANYEFGNKIVLQARNLLVSSNQVIITKVVLHRSKGTENSYFNEISKKNIVYSVSIGMLLLLFAPLAVYIFLGKIDESLIQCIIILNVGWVCNMATSIHYYCCIGLDKMWALVYYHLLLSVVAAVLYFLCNRYLQYDLLYFIVPSIALFLGSVYNSWALFRQIHTAFSWLRSGIFIYFILASIILLVCIYMKITTLTNLVIPVLFLSYLALTLWQYKKGKLFK